VCGFGDIDVLEALGGLVESNLLNRSQYDGESRYWMFETVREYARGRLMASGVERDVRQRFVSYYAEFAARVESELFGDEHRLWLGRVEREQENIRRVMEYLSDGDEVDVGLRIIAGLERAWEALGYLTEPRAWMTSLLDKSRDRDSVARAELLQVATQFALNQGDLTETWRLGEELLALSRRIDHTSGVVGGLLILARFAQDVDHDNPRARVLAEEALRLSEGLPDGERAWVFNAVGWIAIREADYSWAAEVLDRALELSERSDFNAYNAALWHRAFLHTRLGQYDRAATFAFEARTFAAEVTQNTLYESDAWLLIGVASLLGGEVDRAAGALERALKQKWAVGDQRGCTKAIHALAAVAAQRRQHQWAYALRSVALSSARDLRDDFLERDPIIREIDERFLQPWLTQLGSETVERWHRESSELTLELTIEYALNSDSVACSDAEGLKMAFERSPLQ
jgi:tetratricopeptide (TPR) repeat protein